MAKTKQPQPLKMDDVGKEVAAANKLFQPASGECLATPAAMKILLDRLSKYTDETREEAEDNGLDSFYTTQQWATDMGSWQSRLGRYYVELDKVPKDQWNTPEGCHAIYKTVTAPLLDGIWYVVDAPGIVLNGEEIARIMAGADHSLTDVTTPDHPAGHSNPKPPDVAAPFMLANGVKVWNQHVEQEWRGFWRDVGKNAAELFSTVFGWTGEALGGIAAAAGQAIGAGINGFVRGVARGASGGGKGGSLWGPVAFVLGTAALAGGGYVYYKRRKARAA